MKTELQTFQNSVLTASIRCAINEADGAIWFIAGDMAKALDYSETAKMLQHCDESTNMVELNKINSLASATKWINESDLYNAIFGSTKPEAKVFKKWVTSEVLPSIRKTGKYEGPTVATQPKYISDTARAMMAMSRAFGFKGNQAAISADRATKKLIGVSPLELMGADLLAPVKDVLLTPTEIGAQIGISNRQVNKLLEMYNYQERIGDIWALTELGEQFAEVLDTGKKHSTGTPVKQIKWQSRLVDTLKTLTVV